MSEILHVDHVCKKFSRKGETIKANDGISLAVENGHVTGLLGHNGAGKTTLVNQIIGLLRPDSGGITLCGYDAVAHPNQARQIVSVQAQANVPIKGLAPAKAIELVGRMRGGNVKHVRARTRELIDALDIGQWAETPSQKISGGIARLTAFAMTAVVPGRLVILDEPTNDVDPVRRQLLWGQIRALANRGSAVLLVTHNVREAEDIVDSLVILDRGKVISAGRVADLIKQEGDWCSLILQVGEGLLDETFAKCLHRSDDLRVHRTTFTIGTADVEESIHWAITLKERGKITRFELLTPSLEDFYISRVSRGEKGAMK